MKKIVFLSILFCISTLYAQDWYSLSNGLASGQFNQTTDIVNFNNGLAVGGVFSGANGGVNSNNVIFWNGNEWEALGTGLPSNVECLAVFNDELYAGIDVIGSNAIYKWNGASWNSVGTINNSVYSLYVDKETNIMYAGGSFTSPGTYMARTSNGTNWFSVGNGLSAGGQPFPRVNTITSYKGTIYIGGTFTPTGMKYVAKLVDGDWVPLNALEPNNSVTSLMVYNDTLYVGGKFTYFWTGVDPKTYYIGVVKYDGNNWSELTLGQGPTNVEDIKYYNGKIYATGTFTSVFGSSVGATRIAAWDQDSLWSALGGGLDDAGFKLHALNDTLYVGGKFTLADGVANTSKIAKLYNPFVGCNDTNYLEYNADVDILGAGACVTLKVPGCTNPDYEEYNASANYDDGSCVTAINPVLGCTNPNYIEYNPSANTDDGSCVTLIVYGCTDPNYLEYNPDANIDNGTCFTPAIPGCTDSLYIEYDATATVDNGSCNTLIVYGCTDSLYEEYNPEANIDDESCENLVSSIEEKHINNFTIEVYPNPTNGELYIRTNNLIELQKAKINITTILGAQITLKENDYHIQKNNQINISNLFDRLDEGVYLLRLELLNEVFYKKIIKK